MYHDKLLFYLWNVILVGRSFANPDTFEVQDTNSNRKFNLLDLLKDYEESDREQQRRGFTEEPVESWTGRWFPARPDEPALPPKIFPKVSKMESNGSHPGSDQVPMGVQSSTCDDGKTNLTIDWDYSLSSTTCYGKMTRPNLRLLPKIMCKTIPKNYVAMHKCMSDVIEYNEDIPLYGVHRPIWPVYGEYSYIPAQRWLHSLEHGAIVMLYHPCADKVEVKKLKYLVKSCLRRHIITPNNLLDEKRPLALLSWGCIMSMSHVNKKAVVKFIKESAASAGNAPEKDIYRDGEFSDQIKEKAANVSDEKDSILCPM
ncbi:uncharacterized protein LOC106638760 [Copidosoma floridanum]|uniref:uncharacterized protein LOC106638760 n=1 Tax=Copidosoma floridanum TaxID=29053 RepID=UPI0006C9DF6A|nr:uncharacterized protein LOC106638760 [Copidosoma floridanum]